MSNEKPRVGDIWRDEADGEEVRIVGPGRDARWQCIVMSVGAGCSDIKGERADRFLPHAGWRLVRRAWQSAQHATGAAPTSALSTYQRDPSARGDCCVHCGRGVMLHKVPETKLEACGEPGCQECGSARADDRPPTASEVPAWLCPAGCSPKGPGVHADSCWFGGIRAQIQHDITCAIEAERARVVAALREAAKRFVRSSRDGTIGWVEGPGIALSDVADALERHPR